MVVGPKISLQHIPSKGRMSFYRIQNFTIQRRHSVVKIVYGALFVVVSIITAIINPAEIVTSYMLDVKKGSFLVNMWENPSYMLYMETHIFNYTNVEEFLNGETSVLKVEEIGPFKFQEIRTNQNLSIDHDEGVMRMTPNLELRFMPEESYADLEDVVLNMPNLALIAISTLAADKLGYMANLGAYYSISALGSKLFKNMTAHEFLWGYEDPIVSLANRILPGWIDFGKIGIMDRFYAKHVEEIEVEVKDIERKFSINKWAGLEGIKEQGFTDLNTSIKCNRIKGAYEGLMLSPNLQKDKVINIYRKQACRIYPFIFEKAMSEPYGFNYYRYTMDPTAFNRSSPYACPCTRNCLPDGFVDVSGCYYGFPIALSKPHFMDTDPVQNAYYEGMHPDPDKHTSHVDLEPNLGVPIALDSMIQVNIAVRMSAANTLVKPLKDRVVPLLWVSMYCREAPPEIISLFKLRFVIAPPVLITVEVLLFVIGALLGAHGSYRILKPKYKLIQNDTKARKTQEKNKRKLSYPAENKAFRDDEDLAREAVSLLALKEDEFEDVPDLLIET